MVVLLLVTSISLLDDSSTCRDSIHELIYGYTHNIISTTQFSTRELASVKVQSSIACQIILWPAFQTSLKCYEKIKTHKTRYPHTFRLGDCQAKKYIIIRSSVNPTKPYHHQMVVI